jgi:hypothetical protein
MKGHEIETEEAGDGPDRRTRIGVAAQHGQTDLSFRSDRISHDVEITQRQPGLCHQTFEPDLRSGLSLPDHHASLPGGQIGDRADAERIASRHDNPLFAPRPFHDDELPLAQALAKFADIVAVAVQRVQAVDAARQGLAVVETVRSDKSAAAKEGKAAPGFRNAPFQKGIVAARDHYRGLTGFGRRFDGAAIRQPLVDLDLGKQQFATYPRERDLVVLDEVVDLALLDPQIVRQFMRVEKLDHDHRSGRNGGSADECPLIVQASGNYARFRKLRVDMGSYVILTAFEALPEKLTMAVENCFQFRQISSILPKFLSKHKIFC